MSKVGRADVQMVTCDHKAVSDRMRSHMSERGRATAERMRHDAAGSPPILTSRAWGDNQDSNIVLLRVHGITPAVQIICANTIARHTKETHQDTTLRRLAAHAAHTRIHALAAPKTRGDLVWNR